jgi:hypothetical protein
MFRITVAIILLQAIYRNKCRRNKGKYDDILYIHVLFQGIKRNRMWALSGFRDHSAMLNLRKHSNRLINSVINMS